MDPETAKVEQMLVDMVKKFPHPVHREKILSQIVSYLILTKRDIIQALKYIPSLLNIKDLTSIYSLQVNHSYFGFLSTFDLCIYCLLFRRTLRNSLSNIVRALIYWTCCQKRWTRLQTIRRCRQTLRKRLLKCRAY